MKHRFPVFCLTSVALALSGCTADRDLQGVDPVTYYTEHPIENKVEARQLSQAVLFAPGQAKLSPSEEEKLFAGLHMVSPLAVDSIVIQLAADDMHNQARKDTLVKLLRQMGYSKINVQFESSKAVARGAAEIDVAYSAVVAPDCPDWRMSPVTSYSNSWQGNFKCASAVNFGLMVADPHDLVHGSGDVTMSTERSSKAIQDYNSGKDFMPGTQSAGGGSGSSGSSSSGGSGGSSSSNPSGSSTSAVATGTSGLTGGSGSAGQ